MRKLGFCQVYHCEDKTKSPKSRDKLSNNDESRKSIDEESWTEKNNKHAYCSESPT